MVLNFGPTNLFPSREGFEADYDIGFMTRKLNTATIKEDSQEIFIDGLNLDKDKYYLCVLFTDNNSGAGENYGVVFNDDITVTNYYSQKLTVEGASVGAGRANNNRLVDQPVDDGNAMTAVFFVYKSLDGQAFWRTLAFDYGAYDASSIYIGSGGWVTVGTNVKKLTIRSEAANGIGKGSKLVIYKLDIN